MLNINLKIVKKNFSEIKKFCFLSQLEVMTFFNY